jgi:siroheme synthase-like protein
MSSLFPLLPAFLDLTGRAAVLLSGEASLAPLARRLLECGAGVSVFDRAPSTDMAALAPSVRFARRWWRSTDLVGAALVVAGAAEPRLARARAAARAARSLFHAPHEPVASDVRLVEALAGGSIAIGLTAPGLPPEVGQAVARRFEQSAMAGYGRFLEAAVRAAARVEGHLSDESRRAAFWRETADAAFEGGAGAPTDWDGWIAARLDRY